MKKVVDTTCPECRKLFQTEVDVPDAPTLDQIHNTLSEALKGKQGVSSDDIKQILEEQLTPLKPKPEDHRHKTADELLDCPGCRSWFDQTSQRYQVAPKEEKPKEPTFEFGGIRPRETE